MENKENVLFVKHITGYSWRKMALKLGIGYSTLRDWRDGKYLMHHETFLKLIKICPQCEGFREAITGLKKDNWGRRRGGIITKQKKRGFFDPKYVEQQQSWRSIGGRIGSRKWHAQMRADKPLEYRRLQQEKIKKSLMYKYKYGSQKYRNILELAVAKMLTKRGIKFEYEPLVECENRFYLPDFTVENVVLECTYWNDVEQRAKELSQKIEGYSKSGFSEIFIVTFQKYRDEYSRLLESADVRVITPINLREMLDGKIWAGRGSARYSLPKLSTDRAPAS